MKKKINKVSWASGPKLCQVKHFLSEDCPSKVGSGSQHRFQLKSSHVNNIRPSFEGKQCLKQSKESLPYIPQAKWKCPPKFTLNDTWCVVAGEESNETAAQKHREKRVLEAVYPSRSAIPLNSSALLDLDQSYDDNQIPVIPIIPIEEEEVLEVSSHLTPSNELRDPCSSSISIETSQTLPANGKSFSLSFSTSQKVRVPQSNSHISLTQPANGQSAPPYRSRCQNLDRYEQSQVSPKPPVNHKPVPQHSTCQDLSIPLHQTELSPKLPANQNRVATHRSSCENLNIPQLKSQVSGMPPANHNPVPQCPSTRLNMNIPKHQTEFLPKPLANQNAATRCQSTYENLNLQQYKTQISAVPPSNGICVPQYQSTESLSFQDKTQVCSNPPANEKSMPEIPHSVEGDLMVAAATAVAALAKSQEPGSLIDTDLLIKLLSNPKQIQELMKEHQLVTNLKTGAASESKPIVPSTTTPSPTAGSLSKQRAGNERRDPVADSTAFSNSLVRNTNEQRETAAISRPVDPPVPLPRIKSDKVINQPASERQALYARSAPIFGPKPMAKSVSLAVSNPENPMISNLVNGQGPLPHVGTADNGGIRPLVTPDLNMEKVKKLINAYGAPDSLVGRPVLSSPNIVHTSPFSSMTSTPAPAHKDINYYKSLIKQHGENRESVDQELVQNSSRYGNRQGPELLKNLKANQSGLNFKKHCVFFNKPKGCLNGSSCPFLHDTTKQWRSGGMLEAPSSKRVKLGGELTGST